MTHNRKRIVFAQVALAASFALTSAGSLFAQQNVFYAATRATLSTDSTEYVPITGLAFTLPAATTAYNAAIVTLNVSNAYISGTTTSGAALGGSVGITVDGSLVASGSISDGGGPSSGQTGRTPMTVVVQVDLTSSTLNVKGVWEGGQGDFINNDTFGSLSAVLVNK